MSKIFLKRGDFYSQTEGNFEVMPTLDDGIFQIHQNPVTGEIFLEKIADKFEFGFKLYGLDEKLISHVIAMYNKQETKRNIGVLLNGAKGTGKTVTAKVLCNKLGLPVIIVDGPIGGLSQFLAGINHDCVFLFDEFEKNFRFRDEDDEDAAGESLLSIMDGVYNNNHCHVFILTTNELRVNDNLISRPSRIRYLKSFGDVIDKNILLEYIDDNLKYPEYKDALVEFIESLTIGTIDIVKSIVDEINIHNCGVEEFKEFFNVQEATYSYSTRQWSYSLNDGDNYNKKTFLKYAKAPYSEDVEWRPNYCNLTLKRSIKRFKKGDLIMDRYVVIELDLEHSYMLCGDTRYRDNRIMYYFENIDEKPSIYNDHRNTYGYFDWD